MNENQLRMYNKLKKLDQVNFNLFEVMALHEQAISEMSSSLEYFAEETLEGLKIVKNKITEINNPIQQVQYSKVLNQINTFIAQMKVMVKYFE